MILRELRLKFAGVALTEEIFGILPEGLMASVSLMFNGLGERNSFGLLRDVALLTYPAKNYFDRALTSSTKETLFLDL